MPSTAEIRAIHDLPIPDLLFRAAQVHRAHWNPQEIQFCTLDSIKTGACPEDCAYCPQAARYDTGVKPEPLKEKERVLAGARQALANGSTRYCMGAAWREVRDGEAFEQVLEIVAAVAKLDMEVCVTLGMLQTEQAKRLKAAGATVYNHNIDSSRAFYETIISTRSFDDRLNTIRAVREAGLEVCVTLGMVQAEQARRLKAAGATVYNHNIDSSREFYETIISTRKFDDRLATIRAVREAGLEVCSGGIVGMGEKPEDRIHFLHELTLMDPPPESIPINQLVPVAGTPLADVEPPPPMEFIRMIATARILFPKSRIRLSAGRTAMSDETQALAFFAGANSLFTGDKLLTTPNPGESHDHQLLASLGMRVETPARV